MTAPPPDPPPDPWRFAPEGRAARVRFALGGPRAWRGALRALEAVPPHAPPEERWAASRAASARLLDHLGVRLDAGGEAHLAGGPFVVAALHEGLLDVPCLLQLPLPARFVARGEIFGWPAVGPLLARLGHLRVDPEAPSRAYRQLLRGAARALAGGESVAVFAQGTVLGIESDFQPGAFALAARLGVPILPVVLTGTHRVWGHPFEPTLRYDQPVGLRVLPPVAVPPARGAALDALRVRVRRDMKAAALAGDLPAPRRYEPERDGFWDGYRFDIDPDFPELAARVARHRAALTKGTA